jgi:hypothetical protein
VYQPTTPAAIGHRDGQPPNAASTSPTRRTEGLSNRIPFSFVRPALVLLRLLFSVCSPSPQKARALACPSTPGKLPAPAGKNRGAPESAEGRDAFLPFAEGISLGKRFTHKNGPQEGVVHKQNSAHSSAAQRM